MPNPKPQQ